MSKLILGLCTAILAMSATAAKEHRENAAEEVAPKQFNSKVDVWVQGIVLSLDADGRSFSIRGCGMAYATAYARMMKEIRAKTDGATAAERNAKEAEIRASWAETLAKARESTKPFDVDDISFGLPAKGELVILDETGKALQEDPALAGDRNAEAAAKRLPKDQWSDAEANAVAVFSKLRIGEKVAIGYESGIAFNTAYAVVQSENPEKVLGLDQAQHRSGRVPEAQVRATSQETTGRTADPNNPIRK